MSSPTSRRTVLAGIGAAGAAALGLSTMSGSAFGASATISSQNPAAVSNDRGDLAKVTLDPSFRVEWDGFDTAVGKVFILIEARTREDGAVAGAGWTPIFRMFPWLIEDKSMNGGQHVDYSKPGTTGHFEITDQLSQVLKKSIAARTGQTPDRRPLEVVNDAGRPDFDAISYPGGVTKQTFLEGDSVGSASDYSNVSELVNNFPGTDAGYYGAAIDTQNFDVPTDGETDTDTVELRYTFALYSVNEGMIGDSDKAGEGWYEHVRRTDVTSDSEGNSVLVMNGEDSYPDITNQGNRISSSSAVHYPSLQQMASAHPAVTTTTSRFAVTVTNQGASGGAASGSSGTGASGGGQ